MFEQIKKELDELDKQLLLLNHKKDTLINLIKLYEPNAKPNLPTTTGVVVQETQESQPVQPRFQEPIRQGTVKSSTGGEIETTFLTLKK